MSTQTFDMYHGGKRWANLPTEIFPSSKGKYEGGVGLYLTNNYETARNYAKGSRVVHRVSIDAGYRDSSTIKVPYKSMAEYVSAIPKLKRKKEIISDIVRYATRIGKEDILINVLNNLIVNYEAGAGDAGKHIINYMVSNGADASKQTQSGAEVWLVVFNPKILKAVSVVNPTTIGINDFMLPPIK